MKSLNYRKCMIDSILAGFSISLGCLINLASENKVVGAMFFTVGLFLVLTREYSLFTGKVSNLLNNLKYLEELVVIWFGNLVGCLSMVLLVKMADLNSIEEKASIVAGKKIAESNLSVFILGVLCGIIIYLAVSNYKTAKSSLEKIVGLFLFIPIFILLGFEHCVADMFYLFFINTEFSKIIIFLLFATLGNSVGAIGYKWIEENLREMKK